MPAKKYRIVGFETLSYLKLQPHPEVSLPISLDDSQAIGRSLDEVGVYQPLLVSAAVEKDSGRRLIYDGVNRWDRVRAYAAAKGASTLNLSAIDDGMLPCMLVECDDPRLLALECLATRRKCSTGQRIMAYLEQHRAPVLATAKAVLNGLIQYRKSIDGVEMAPGDMVNGFLTSEIAVSHVTHANFQGLTKEFQAEAIAKRLGVSRKDVGLGIELLMMEEVSAAADKPKYTEQRMRLFEGSQPIRRWKAAVKGKWTPQKGKLDVDYGGVADRSMKGLVTVFTNWKKLDPSDRARFEKFWAEKVAPVIPEVLR